MFNQYIKNIKDDEWLDKPVDVMTFTTDDYYIGKSTRRGETIYPYWKEFLKKVFSPNSEAKNFLMTDPIGTGKSKIIAICASYFIYTVACLKDPIKSLGLVGDENTKLLFSFLSDTTGNCISFEYLKDIIRESEWFTSNCNIKKSWLSYIINDNIAINHGRFNEISCGHANSHVLFTYIEFFPELKYVDQYNEIADSIIGKCVHDRTTIIIETGHTDATWHIHKEFENLIYLDKRFMKVSDFQWLIKPVGTFSGKMFTVAYNNEQIKIIETVEDLDGFDNTATIIRVPIELKSSFKVDPELALKDLAGIAPLKRTTIRRATFSKAFEYLQNDKLRNVTIILNGKRYFKDYRDQKTIMGEYRYGVDEVKSFTVEEIQSENWIIQYDNFE